VIVARPRLRNKTPGAVHRGAVYRKSTAATGKMLKRVLIVTCLFDILSAFVVYGPYSNVYVWDYEDDVISVGKSDIPGIASAQAVVNRWMCISYEAYQIRSVVEEHENWFSWRTSPAYHGGDGAFPVSFRANNQCAHDCPVLAVSNIFWNFGNGQWNLIENDAYSKPRYDGASRHYYLWKDRCRDSSDNNYYDCWLIGNELRSWYSLWGYRWGGNLFDPCDNSWNYCEPWWIGYHPGEWIEWDRVTVTCSSAGAGANDGNAVDGTDDLPEGLDLLSIPLPPRGGSDQSDATHSGSGDYAVMIASAGAAAAFILMVAIVINVVWRRRKRVSRDSTLKTDVAEHVTEMTPSNLDQEVMNQRMSSNGDAPGAVMEEKSAEKGIGIGVKGAVQVFQASAVSMEIANTAVVTESL